MRISALIAALLACAPARAQIRVEPVSALHIAAPTPRLTLPSAPSAPALLPPPLLSAPLITQAAPIAAAPAPTAAARPAAARIAALQTGVSETLTGLGEEQVPSAAKASSAGRALEDLLTGARGAAASGDLPGPSATAQGSARATSEELDYAANAATALSALADDIGAERGQKASRMSGGDFIDLVEAARARADASDAPSPAASEIARVVRAQTVRVVRALTDPRKPLSESVKRTLSVWQVFGQVLAEAAAKGRLDDIAAEARLFASQVEDSVEPARPRPEDPEGYATIAVPGSVFGWKPIETSPGHGLVPLDALIRFALSDKRRSGDAKGFVLPGAARREDALVHFYGERHSDGELIKENMRRLAADMRPDRPAIVLVEGYTGPALRGYQAQRYLSDRGLDADEIPDDTAVEVRGWDTIDGYSASKHPLLQHHMDLLELNRLAHGPQRGLSYYAVFARAAWAAVRGWSELWKAAIVARNGDLDRAVARAAAEADKTGATVHVIAGSDHLLQNPRLRRLPLLGRPVFRKGLLEALRGRSYWASKPPEAAR